MTSRVYDDDDDDEDYFLVRRRRPRRERVYYEDDNDDDDDDDEHHSDILHHRETRRRPVKYFSNEDIRPRRPKLIEPVDDRLQIRRARRDERILYARLPSPVDHRRRKFQSYDRQPLYYETSDGRYLSRPPKQDLLKTRKTQVVYAEDEPSKLIKRVIIDPRTGDRETIYEKERAKKHQKYFVQRHRASVILDDEDDDDDQDEFYRRLIKPREKKYIKIRHTAHSDPIYSLTSKLPVIKTGHRRKAISDYRY